MGVQDRNMKTEAIIADANILLIYLVFIINRIIPGNCQGHKAPILHTWSLVMGPKHPKRKC